MDHPQVTNDAITVSVDDTNIVSQTSVIVDTAVEMMEDYSRNNTQITANMLPQMGLVQGSHVQSIFHTVDPLPALPSLPNLNAPAVSFTPQIQVHVTTPMLSAGPSMPPQTLQTSVPRVSARRALATQKRSSRNQPAVSWQRTLNMPQIRQQALSQPALHSGPMQVIMSASSSITSLSSSSSSSLLPTPPSASSSIYYPVGGPALPLPTMPASIPFMPSQTSSGLQVPGPREPQPFTFVRVPFSSLQTPLIPVSSINPISSSNINTVQTSLPGRDPLVHSATQLPGASSQNVRQSIPVSSLLQTVGQRSSESLPQPSMPPPPQVTTAQPITTQQPTEPVSHPIISQLVSSTQGQPMVSLLTGASNQTAIPLAVSSSAQPIALSTQQAATSHVQPTTVQLASQTEAKAPEMKPDAVESDEDADGCPICFESYTNSGDHRMASLKCGHLFGLSCIEKWLKGQGGKCPQCNSKAKKADIRILYAKTLRALDTAERDRALQDLEREREARRKAEVEEAQTRIRYQQTVQECMKLRQELERKNQQMQNLRMNPNAAQIAGLSDAASVSVTDKSGSFTLEKTVKIWEAGGCRVMAYCSVITALVVSQPSSNPLFPGFGVKKISSVDFKTSQYVPLHAKAVRDVAFNPSSPDCLLLSGSMDKTLKITNMISNSVVQTYTNPVPVWACCWNEDDGNYFYGGLMNGTVCVFDIRNTSDCVNRLNTAHRSPIVSLQYVPRNPQASFRPGGILVGQINNSAFYERKQDSEYKQHALPLEGNLVSLTFEESTRHILATYRPSKVPSVRHQMFELTSSNVSDNAAVIDTACSCNPVSTFHGGNTQKLLSRTRLFAHPAQRGQLIGCAGDEASNAFLVWDPSCGQLKQRITTSAPVIDMCTVRINQQSLLATMTEKQVSVYKYQ